MAYHLTPDVFFYMFNNSIWGGETEAMTVQQCISLPLQVQCITNRMHHDDKVEFSGHTKKKQGGGDTTAQHGMGTHTTDVPFSSRKLSCSDRGWILIQIAEVSVNRQGAEQRRDKLYKQETKNKANTRPFPDASSNAIRA